MALEEFTDEQASKAIEMIDLFKETCQEMGQDENETPDIGTYITQIKGYFEAMQAVVPLAQAEYAIAEVKENEDDEIKRDEKEFTRNWHSNHPGVLNHQRSLLLEETDEDRGYRGF
jgi:hypothetical protein